MAPQIVSSTDKSQSWYLKIDDGSVYGPVPFGDLNSWAADGRIAPGDELSSDRQGWVPAESITELEMVWMIEVDNDSVYGPLNANALPELVKGGMITPRMNITHSKTKEKFNVRDVLKTMGAVPNVALNPKLRTRAAEPRDDIFARVQGLETRARAATKAHEDAIAEFDEIQMRHADEVEQRNRRAQTLEQQLKDSQKQYAAVAARLKVAEGKLEAGKSKAKRVAGGKKQGAEPAAELGWDRKEVQLLQRIEELQKNLETAETDYGSANEERSKDNKEHQQALKAAHAREDKLTQRITTLETELREPARPSTTAQLQALQKKAESLSQALDKSRQELTQARERLNSRTAAFDGRTRELHDEARERESLAKRLLSYEAESEKTISELRHQNELTSAEIDRLKLDLEKEQALQVELEGSMREREESLAKKALELGGRAERAEASLKKAQDDLRKTKTDAERISVEEDRLRQKLDELTSRVHADTQSRDAMSAASDQATRELKALREQVDELRAGVRDAEERAAAEKHQGDEAGQRAVELDQQLKRERKRLEQMELELAKQLEMLERNRSRLEAQKEELSTFRSNLDQERRKRQELETECHAARLKLEQCLQELEQQRAAVTEEQSHNARQMQDLQLQFEQLQGAYEEVCDEFDARSSEFESNRAVIKEEHDREMKRLQQETQALQVRLEQQKSFYDEEREARQQKEMEVLNEKKKYQDLFTSMRQGEQRLTGQVESNEQEMESDSDAGEGAAQSSRPNWREWLRRREETVAPPEDDAEENSDDSGDEESVEEETAYMVDTHEKIETIVEDFDDGEDDSDPDSAQQGPAGRSPFRPRPWMKLE